MTKDTGGPAFPQYKANATPGGGIHYDMSGGMTLRDWFAGMAMAQLCVIENTHSTADDAKSAYRIADAMLAERSKP